MQGTPESPAASFVDISLTCLKGSIMHEILHGLGAKHEHLHPSGKIQVRSGRIKSGKEHNYSKDGAVAVTEFDIDSIMKYSSESYNLCRYPSDPKWLELPKEELPNMKCMFFKTRYYTQADGTQIDCLKECAPMPDENANPFENNRSYLSQLDIEGIRLLYKDEA